MAYITGTIWTNLDGATAYTVPDHENLYLAATGLVGSDFGNAILVTGIDQNIYVAGTAFAGDIGVFCNTGGRSVVHVSAGGLVTGFTAGVELAGINSFLQNDGEIHGNMSAIVADMASATIINTGLIGSVGGTGVYFAAEGGTLDNSGTIAAKNRGVLVYGDSATVLNTGTITVSFADGFALRFAGSLNDVTNDGTIAIAGGTAIGFVDEVSPGDNDLRNSGLIDAAGGEAVLGCAGVERVVNTGTIFGAVTLQGGNDLYDGRAGHLFGLFAGGDGNDTALGGAEDETIQGDAGDDSLSGAAGADSLQGGDGADTIRGAAGPDTMDGGGGTDVLDYAYSAAGVQVDLLAGEATGGDGMDDEIGGFEWARGSGYADTLTGDGLANRLWGGAGKDVLAGGAGNDALLGQGGADTMAGGQGADTLIGGLGADTLSGGAGNDLFRYISTGESPSAARDLVADFTPGLDDIDLSAIDANDSIAGDPSFVFRGTQAFTAAGQVRYVQIAASGITEVQVNTIGTDQTPEMVIVLTGLKTLAATDFVL